MVHSKNRQGGKGGAAAGHVYVKQADGSEKICKREKILGPVSELTKARLRTGWMA